MVERLSADRHITTGHPEQTGQGLSSAQAVPSFTEAWYALPVPVPEM